MKKFYAFFAAALISVCAFASKEEVPTDAVLANYYESGQLCVCIYVPSDLKCADIVFVGTYNDWNASAAACKKFEPVENYDGWYVVAVDDDGRPEDPEKDPYSDLEGKPVQLDVNGDFNWDYQVGAATYIRGGAQIVEGGIKGEIDIKQYTTDAPNVYTVDEWKKDPCSAVYNSYTIAVINDGCDGFAVPFVVGSFTNNWKFQQMQVDVAKTQELQAGYYFYSFRAAAGAEFQIVSGLMDATGAITVEPAWADDAYIQEYSEEDDLWSRINGGANFVLGDEALILFDLRVDTLRWARCAAPEEAVDVYFLIDVPEGAPAAGIEVIGTFDEWAGTAMSWDAEKELYYAAVQAKPSDEFKFREAGTWDNEIEELQEDGTWKGLPNMVFGKFWDEINGEKFIVIDFSDPAQYRWKVTEGIENVVLTEKAQKVVVDGVIYIVRDNKLFNLQGAQVR